MKLLPNLTWTPRLKIHKKMAQLNYPYGVFVSNDEVFIADTLNYRVRKLLRNGQIVTIAGNGIRGYDGDGQLATNAQLYYPTSVIVSSADQVYIADGKRIRKIDRNGIISTIAGTVNVEYNGDDQLAVHANMFVTADEEFLIADSENDRVRKIDRFGIITTVAGNGTKGYNGDGQLATTAQLFHPLGVFQHKHEIYISDHGNCRIRKIDRNGIISTIVGPDIINDPTLLFVHNGELYFTQYELCKAQLNGTITTIRSEFNRGINDDCMGMLNFPVGIFVEDSHIYIADTNNNCIRRIDQEDGKMRTIVGTEQRVMFHLISISIHILGHGRNQKSNHFQLLTMT